MKRATLQIQRADTGTLFTYSDALFSDDTLKPQTQMEDGELKKGKVDVTVRTPTLMGVEVNQDPYARQTLPDGWHRAILIEEDGREIINGAVHGFYGVATGAGAGGAYQWKLSIEDQALEDVLLKMEETRMDEQAVTQSLQEGRDYLALETNEGGDTNAVFPWVRPRALWRRYIEALPGVIEGDPPEEVFPLSFSSVEFDTEVLFLDSTRPRATGLPSLTGRDYYDILRGAQGARLFASYTGFPGREVAVSLRFGEWKEPPEGEAQPLTSGAGGYDWSTRKAGQADYAISYANGLPRRQEYVGEFEAELGVINETVPVGPAIYGEASGEWHTNADGESQARSLETIGLTIPRLLQPETITVSHPDLPDEERRLGIPVASAGDSSRGEDPPIYAVSVAENAEGKLRAIEWRKIPIATAGVDLHLHELWPASLMRRQELKAVPMRKVQGTFRAPAKRLEVGRFPNGTAVVEGINYLAEKVGEDLAELTIEATLIRPARRLTEPTPPPRGTPAAVAAKSQLGPGGTSDTTWLSWADPVDAATPDGYQIQIRIAENDTGDFNPWRTRPSAFANLFGAARYQWRIRSLYRWAPPSDWVYTQQFDRN